MPWIYSYAELGPQNVESLLGHAPFTSLPASTPNSRVVFRGRSRKWSGATATLERSKGNWVYGSALLVSEEELTIFDKYFQNYSKVEISVLIDATKDKIKAISYILDPNLPLGKPSDDYVKEMLKHLRFFWGQGEGKNLNLENFGIVIGEELESGTKPVKNKEKAPISQEAVNSLVADINQSVKPKRKKSKAQ